ncbi:hypothetical protein GCM10023100_15930 [Actinocorallia cavernae]|uniref:Uncharacterized protein n=1 Tax=Actinocorallia cavernae TaxID=328075 RepID=A0ABP8SEX5_9ACTN
MRIPPRAARIGAAAAVLSALLAGGTVSAGTANASVVSATSPVSAASVGSICHSTLPPQADDTLDLIAKGGPYPYSQDGTVFSNREGVLPSQSSGYYHEYTVVTPAPPPAAPAASSPVSAARRTTTPPTTTRRST